MQAFEYRTPKSLKEVQQDLKQFGGDAKLIAGGTALVIMMKQRLVRPSCLVSLRSVRGLNGIAEKNGGIAIGGAATHRAVEGSSLVKRRLPVLAETYHHVATVRVRNMATVGGGLAHADPNQDPNAHKFDRLTYMEALERRLRVMDTTALSLCMDNKLPIIVFDLTDEGNLLRLVEGDRSVGTLVS